MAKVVEQINPSTPTPTPSIKDPKVQKTQEKQQVIKKEKAVKKK